MLQETYVPTKLPHRETEMSRLLATLTPLTRGHGAENIIIYGKSGTGKTAVARSATDQIVGIAHAEGQSVSRGYVNCAVASTPYAFLRELANDLRPEGEKVVGEKLGLHAVYQKIRTFCDERGGAVVIIIDEVDKVKGETEQKGREFLYSISNINAELKNTKVTLILITNELDFGDKLDTRIKSRLSASRYLFPPYNQLQLQDILKERADMVFAPGALETEVVPMCAVLAAREHGDARKAVALLRASARIAQEELAEAVTADHVMRARGLVEFDAVSAGVHDLPDHDKIILLGIVAPRHGKSGPPTMGEAYRVYCTIAETVNYPAITLRNFRNHIWDLENQGLVKAQLQNLGRGGGRNHLLYTDAPAKDIVGFITDHEVLGPIAKNILKEMAGTQTRLG